MQDYFLLPILSTTRRYSLYQSFQIRQPNALITHSTIVPSIHTVSLPFYTGYGCNNVRPMVYVLCLIKHWTIHVNQTHFHTSKKKLPRHNEISWCLVIVTLFPNFEFCMRSTKGNTMSTFSIVSDSTTNWQMYTRIHTHQYIVPLAAEASNDWQNSQISRQNSPIIMVPVYLTKYLTG